MLIKTCYFLAIFFTALTLSPAMAHLLELPNKMYLTREEYLVVQQIYRGWALLGVVVFSAVIATGVLSFVLRREWRPFIFSVIAFLCLVGAQVVFWSYTYPANSVTNNWTMLPDNWETLRRQWEFSHATGALLTLVAMASVIVSLLVHKETPKIDL